MSIFGKIMSAIFGTKATAAPAGAAPASATPPSGGAAAGATAAGGSPAAAPAAAQTVDVAPILDKAVAAKGEKLDWRTSIVDLMKASISIPASRRARNSRRNSATPATPTTPPA